MFIGLVDIKLTCFFFIYIKVSLECIILYKERLKIIETVDIITWNWINSEFFSMFNVIRYKKFAFSQLTIILRLFLTSSSTGLEKKMLQSKDT